MPNKKALGWIVAAAFVGTTTAVAAIALMLRRSAEIIEIHLFTPEELAGKEKEIEELIPKETPAENQESEEN